MGHSKHQHTPAQIHLQGSNYHTLTVWAVTDIWAQITLARTQPRKMLQALSSDVALTVACLIKARDEEVGSSGAVKQEVSGVTLPTTAWKMKADCCCAFSSSPSMLFVFPSKWTTNIHLRPSLNLCTGINRCFHVKQVDIHKFSLWQGLIKSN